ncbi:leucine-rich repeat protein SHOC-2-like [Clytia hemisphaerica]|uniref:Leucine rich repeat containing protein n=1 Tax=Clytia hemisphaerica TaxID=252671 RepID=A0A7M6DPN2_9CNID
MIFGYQLIFIAFMASILPIIQCCPPSCRCVETTTTLDIDCSNIGLTEILNLSPNVTRLSLNGNKIQSLAILKTMSFPRLEFLELSNNPIRDVPVFAFKGIPSLKELIITTDTIVESSFDGLELESLTLIGVKMETLPARFLDSSRDTLKALTVQNTEIEELKFDFPNLETLILTGNHLTTFVFDGETPNLKDVTLSKNKFKQIQCIQPLQNVTYLDVSYNQLRNLTEDFSRCFSNLTDVKLQNNALSTLPIGFFSSLQNTLQSIDLSHNPLTTLSTDELRLMLKLKELRLQNMGSIDIDLSPMENWEKFVAEKGLILDLSYNTKLKSYQIPRNIKLDKLIFTNSELKTFPILNHKHGDIVHIEIQMNNLEKLIIARPVAHLNASHNKIRFINISYEWTKIDILDVGHNLIESTRNIHIYPNTYLKYVNLTFNKLKQIHPFYQAPPDIRGKYGYKISPIRMDFSYNSISSINRSAFFGLQPMVSLKLNNNNITSLPDDLLLQQPHLNKLDLNHNKLQQVPTELLRTIKLLSYLLLKDNQINQILPTDLQGLFRLLSLDLSSNYNLSKLPSNFLSRNKRLRRFSIFNTSIDCTCNLTSILQNIIMTNKRLKYDGHCLDKSTSHLQHLKTIVETSEANPWFCSTDCPTLKCILQNECTQRIDTSMSFNCSCQNLNNNTDSNTIFNFPIFNNPPWIAPARESPFSRNLIFCQTTPCSSDTDFLSRNGTNNSTRRTDPSFRHPESKCRWSLNKESNLQTGILVECSRIPVLTEIFCKPFGFLSTTISPRSKNASFPQTTKAIIGLSVGALFLVGIFAYFGHKWKARRSVTNKLTDTYILTDFDYLNDISSIDG